MRSRFESLIAGALGALLSAVLLGPLVRSVDASYTPLPAGAIAHFNSTSCPAGWTEFTAGRGFYILNRVASGTLATGVGTALTDQENRATGIHSHTASSTAPGINDPGHTHNIKKDPAAAGPTPNAVIITSNFSAGNFIASESNTTGITANAPAITVNNSAGVAGTNAPYIQLLACQKS